MTDQPFSTNGGGTPAGGAPDLQDYLDIARRRWWLILGAVVVCVGVSFWTQRGRLPMYTAEVLLQQRVEAPVMGLANQRIFGGGGDFGSQVAILRSRAILARAVDSLGLRLVLHNYRDRQSEIFTSVKVDPEAPRGSYTLEPRNGRVELRHAGTGQVVAVADGAGRVEGPGFRVELGTLEGVEEPIQLAIRHTEEAVEALRSRLRVEQGTGADLIRVGYRWPDARMAAAVVNTVALSYQDYRARTAQEAAGRRRDVIANELVSLADSLRDAQSVVESYQASAQLLDPGVEGGALMSALLETENELRRLRFEDGLLSSLVAGLQGDDPNDESLRRVMAMGRELVPAGQALDGRLQELQAQRRQLTADRFGVTEASPQVQVLDAQIASVREQMRITAEQALALLRSRIQAAEERIVNLRGQIGNLPARTAELTRLQQRVDAVQEVFDVLVGRYYEAQIQEGVEAGDIALVDPSPVPLWPDTSRTTLTLLIALMTGLVIGGVGALVVEQLDSSVRRAPQAERAAGLPVLGTVPNIRSLSSTSKSMLIGKEAFRGIRTNLRFAMAQQPRLLAVSSAAPGEGKSTVAVNLALTLVEQGGSVLIVDADLRRAQVHRILGVPQAPGLAEVLEGRVTLKEAVRPSPVHPGLHVLPSGRAVRAHADMVGGDRFRELLRELKARYDTVLVDTPPVLAVADASLVANAVDGTVIVVRANETDQEALENAVEQLRRVDAPLVGLILNDVAMQKVGYAAYYKAYYLDEPGKERSSGKGRRRILLGPSGQASGTD